MNSSWRVLTTSNRLRKFLCVSVLVSLVCSTIPVPVLLNSGGKNDPATEKDSSEPFPCQNRPCGCRTAKQCWKKCCCFTNQQKVAWAKANAVKVPEFVLAAAKNEAGESTCCQSARPRSDTPKTIKSKSKTCCQPAGSVAVQQSDLPECCRERTDAPPKSKPTLGLVIGSYEQECRGQGWGIGSIPWSTVQNEAIVVEFGWTQLDTASVPFEAWSSRLEAPPTPPPRA